MRTIAAPFVVPVLLELEGKPATHYLQPNGSLDPSEATAVRFEIYASPTPVERDRIRRVSHDLAGGLREFIDLERGCENARLATLALVERELWPNGRPKAALNIEEQAKLVFEQDAALGAAWEAHDSIEKRGFTSMSRTLERIIFMATWRVLIVRPPPGWESIADREGVDDGIFYSIWSAWNEATAGARAGK